MRTENSIIQPLLRLREVATRGALYGLAAIPLLAVACLCVSDHHDRRTFPGVVGFLAAFMAVTATPVGLLFWWACGGDIRRCRDWHTVTVAAPVLVRAGVLALVLCPGVFGLHFLVDNSEYGGFWYGS